MSLYSSASHRIQPKVPTKKKCITVLETTEVSFEWIINDFSMRPEENGKYVDSCTFAAGDNAKVKWYLRLYPNGDKEGNEGCLSLYLYLNSGIETEFRAKFEFSILNAQQEKRQVTASNGSLFRAKGAYWGFEKFIKRDVLQSKPAGLLIGDKLVLHCEVKTFANSVNKWSKTKKFKVPDSRLSEDFGKLREDQDSADVILSVNGHELSAHKNILSARSPVFAAMFRHDMTEAEHKRVEITDIDPETIKEMLDFIYTGKAPNLHEMACDLLVASDKYDLDRLKAMCEETLSSNLSVDNACDVLVLADAYDAKQLKPFVLDYVTRQAVDVMTTVGWKSMETHHPKLISEICRAVIKSSKPAKRI